MSRPRCGVVRLCEVHVECVRIDQEGRSSRIRAQRPTQEAPLYCRQLLYYLARKAMNCEELGIGIGLDGLWTDSGL